MLFLFLSQEGIEETDVRRIEKRMEKTISDLMATIHRIQVSYKLSTSDHHGFIFVFPI